MAIYSQLGLDFAAHDIDRTPAVTRNRGRCLSHWLGDRLGSVEPVSIAWTILA